MYQSYCFLGAVAGSRKPHRDDLLSGFKDKPLIGPLPTGEYDSHLVSSRKVPESPLPLVVPLDQSDAESAGIFSRRTNRVSLAISRRLKSSTPPPNYSQAAA
eukprot:6899243-Pyramimonas_sp.AAC.1